jgi:peroxiredoxin
MKGKLIMKLEKGKKFPNFDYFTAYESDKNLYEEIDDKKSVVYFLRYYGCTVCQLDLMEIKNAYKDFKAKGTEVKVVLQSDPELLKKELDENPLPYEIICDPEMNLYKKFEIKVAESMEKLVGGDSMEKVKKAEEAGFEHGKYEGEEQQLPAVFLINEDKTIEYAQYTKNLADLKSPEEILEMI